MNTSSNSNTRTVTRFVEPSDLHAKYPLLAGAIACMLGMFFEDLDTNDPANKQDKAVKSAYQRMYHFVEDYDRKAAGIGATATYAECVRFGLVSEEAATAEPEKVFDGLFFDSPQEQAAAKRLMWAAFNDLRGAALAAIEERRAVEKKNRDEEIANRKAAQAMCAQRRAYLRKLRNEAKLSVDEAAELECIENELREKQIKVATSLGDSPALKAIRDQLAKATAVPVPVVATETATAVESSVEAKPAIKVSKKQRKADLVAAVNGDDTTK